MKLVGETGMTAWGLSTLQALEGASEEQRREIGTRACKDAAHDAELLGQVQLGLFEKLEVIHRHELWRFHFIEAGGVDRSCESMEEFIRHAVAPRVQHNRHTMHRMQSALSEATRLREAYGTCKAPWTVLGYLAAETRRQAEGNGHLLPNEHARLSAGVASGKVTQRELVEKLKDGCSGGAGVPLTEMPRPPAEGEPSALLRMVRRTTQAGRLLVKSLEQIEYRLAGSWDGVSYQDLVELQGALEPLRRFHPDRVAACCRVVEAELIFRRNARSQAKAS